MNWKSVSGIATILALVAIMTACAGYTLADFTKVKVAPGVQEVTGSPEKVSLTRAPFVRQQYVDTVKNDLAELDQSISDAQLFNDFLGSLLNTGLQVAEGPLEGLPAGGLIFATLGGLTGLFVRKPGDSKKIRDAAIDRQIAAKQAHDSAWDEAAAQVLKAVETGKKLKAE